MILVDLSAVFYSAFYSIQKLEEGIFRHVVLNSLRSYNLKYRAEYGDMVICCDGKSYWRKAKFAQYKAARKVAREADDVNWDEVFRIMDIVREEIITFMPWKTLRVDGCESDDIIATLVENTQEFGCCEKVMILSADGDFAQLQKYSNVRQFSPMQGKMIGEKKPIEALRIKILRGDPGDGIPNIYSPDNCFVDKIRQTPLSKKKMDVFLANWDNLDTVMNENQKRNFQRNKLLIDFSSIPQEIRENVTDKYNHTTPPTNSGVLTYLISKRLSQLISCAADFFPPKHTS
jgi:hypothetical protein